MHVSVTVYSVAFQGIETRPVEVQIQITPGLPAFSIVGLPDKTVGESRERVRGALHALGLSLPPKHLTVNLAPADLMKEGSHFDLPIAFGILAALDILPLDALEQRIVLGELALDASVRAVQGVLPAAVQARAMDYALICPRACGPEAAWAAPEEVLAPTSLLQIINHFKGSQIMAPVSAPKFGTASARSESGTDHRLPDLAQVKGQETARRALEVAAAGGHNLLMSGPPGSGKSLLASCLPGILPPLEPKEALEISMVHSLAGLLPEDGLVRVRPFRNPHHSASMPALVGGGHKAKPGEISLAHGGVLFLDELPEFARPALEALRQPLETGEAVVSRANAHVRYPARFQLIAAMNPCRCGHLGEPDLECTKAPRCGAEYQARLSGPFLDRMDIRVDVPPVSVAGLADAPSGESSAVVAARVAAARQLQAQRAKKFGFSALCNADYKNQLIDDVVCLEGEAKALMTRAAETLRLSARAWYRILRVARTVADLDGSEHVDRRHIAEALGYRGHINEMQRVA